MGAVRRVRVRVRVRARTRARSWACLDLKDVGAVLEGPPVLVSVDLGRVMARVRLVRATDRVRVWACCWG